jgi:Flp pilus assembly protein TadD
MKKSLCERMAAALLASAAVLFVSSCGSAKFIPPADTVFGEKAPLLAGTKWQLQETHEIFQLRAGGELVVPGASQSNWSRDGDSIVFFIGKGHGDYYWNRWQGTYDAETQTMWGTWQNSGDFSRFFTLVRYKDNIDRVIEDYTQFIRLDPNNAVAYMGRGLWHYKKGNIDEAIEDYTQVIKLNPNYTSAYMDRGIAYADKGDLDRAIEDYTQAIRLNPNYTSAYINRGWYYIQKKEYDKALADCNQVIRLNPNDVAAHINRGWAHNGKGEYDKALTDCYRALQISPNNGEAHYVQGTAYKAKGNKTQADKDFAEAKRLGYAP